MNETDQETADDDVRRALAEACRAVGLDPSGARVVRLGENAIFQLPGHRIARVSRPGRFAAAALEVQVARWLARHDVAAIRVLDGIASPIEYDGRAVTFWQELPAHRHGTPVEVAAVLRQLHALPVPDDPALPELDPFRHLDARIAAASTLTAADRDWLQRHLADLRRTPLAAGMPRCVIHGDAWAGNIVTTTAGVPLLIDLERVSVGPPEWDLVSTAIKYRSFGWVSAAGYQDFCDRYGHDVTTAAGFPQLRDIRELRMTCYAAQHAGEHPEARAEADLRVDCLRGRRGPRPWNWAPTL